ncbi:hypothetical protein SAMN05216575_1183 [Ectopseudomonas alcaliphila]|uniref:Uncharacterized protein n=1 Tax=Ectopseudomonas alcaliphila TaxID=101564 RepID=A0A1G7QL45_9GAMM|nr:hypothetical protein SAMN05216575_1183 [Pseudomonas alcaliphila]
MQKQLSTHISDEFEGWDGDTVYELDNREEKRGQIYFRAPVMWVNK